MFTVVVVNGCRRVTAWPCVTLGPEVIRSATCHMSSGRAVCRGGPTVAVAVSHTFHPSAVLRLAACGHDPASCRSQRPVSARPLPPSAVVIVVAVVIQSSRQMSVRPVYFAFMSTSVDFTRSHRLFHSFTITAAACSSQFHASSIPITSQNCLHYIRCKWSGLVVRLSDS